MTTTNDINHLLRHMKDVQDARTEKCNAYNAAREKMFAAFEAARVVCAADEKAADEEFEKQLGFAERKVRFLLEEFYGQGQRMTAEEYFLTMCEQCGQEDCIHRGCYRRLPRSQGGLGECPRLKQKN